MKRMLSLFLAVAVVVFLPGCGKKKGEPAGTEAPAVTAPAPTDAEDMLPAGFSDDTAYQAYLEKIEKLPSVEADTYFEHRSEVVEATKATKSKAVMTETAACEAMEARGFSMFPITAEYSMDGVYAGPTEISTHSSSTHPVYQTGYVTAAGGIWMIFIINGAVMAEPISYNTAHASDVHLILSERETVTSYDSGSNKFYETIPDPSVLAVMTLPRIDSDTLETLTEKELDAR